MRQRLAPFLSINPEVMIAVGESEAGNLCNMLTLVRSLVSGHNQDKFVNQARRR